MACCGKSEIDSNDIKTNDFTKHLQKLHGSDKISLIIRIQANFRGFLARKRVQRMRETMGYNNPGMAGRFHMSPDGQANYENPDVIVRIHLPSY